MKKITLIIVFIYYSLQITNAQWIQQNSGIQENLYDIKFINKNTGWTLGDGGIVLKTTNGGNNWINIPNPSISAGGILSSVFPVDSNVVYVVGGHEVILKTTNGGTNWIIIRNGPNGLGTGFRGVYFLNKDTGWVCGSMRVLRTTNGGLTFDSAGIFWGSLADIYFKDFNTGIICGDGRVFKTTDGGMNWFNTNVPLQTAAMFLRLGVANKQYVCVSGMNAYGVYKSTNFATSWIKTDSLQLPGAYGMYFLNKDTGFAGNALNMLFKTTDGGYNWKQENTGTGVVAQITSVYFLNDSIGWYASCAGKIFHTTTGGQVMQITNSNEQIAKDFKLYQNYPNPFNSETTIEFEINQKGIFRMEVFDLLGRKIEALFIKQLNAGKYQYKFNANNISSGIYFYKISNSNSSITKTMSLIK
ncbi:MAG: T9SS type A sorting domain-containing protein [Ignavibacteriae bacterium]|nr:T9SS type A sorting domain-containing protein [Ignavibacteriota bacterium]